MKVMKGFTLIKVLITLAIIMIIASIVIIGGVKYIAISKEKVCEVNRIQLQKEFNLYYIEHDGYYDETYANEFILEIEYSVCPSGGEITYRDGYFYCSIHNHKNNDDDVGDEIPYLKNDLD